MTIELDGDHPDVRPGSWLVLQQGATVRPCEIEAATPGGAARYALSGPVTRVRLRTFSNLREFSRREVTVFCVSTAHPATRGPLDDTVSGDTLTVGPHEPALPPRRRVLVVGQDTSGAPRATTAVVSSVTARATGRMVLKLTEPLSGFGFRGLTVLGNVATATHGETVEQVLGSGDGSTAFAGYPLRRSPLTHVRAATPEGCRPELEVRVDGVLWQRVADLAGAGAHERVYTLREREDGTTLVGFGDGVTGARPSTGVENIVARYRVGIGEPGAVAAGRVVVLTRRPLGLRDAVNPAPTGDYEASESMADARSRAPGTVRTLDRVVSLVDHEHFAAGYAGVGAARADLVWDGRRQRVAVTVLGAHGTPLSPAGRAGLAEQLDRARDPVSPLDVLGGEAIPFRVTVALKHDPARERTAVLTAAEAALRTAYGPGTLPFAEPVTASDVLVTLKEVPGVAACAMPVLSPPSPAQARPAGWSGGSLPAQVLYLDTVTFEELT